jgi:hypothetical protein
LLHVFRLVIYTSCCIVFALYLLALIGLLAILAPVAGILFSNVLFYVPL